MTKLNIFSSIDRLNNNDHIIDIFYISLQMYRIASIDTNNYWPNSIIVFELNILFCISYIYYNVLIYCLHFV